jgi:hypothetical protein
MQGRSNASEFLTQDTREGSRSAVRDRVKLRGDLGQDARDVAGKGAPYLEMEGVRSRTP